MLLELKMYLKFIKKIYLKKKEYFLWEREFLFLRSNVFFLLTLPFLS